VWEKKRLAIREAIVLAAACYSLVTPIATPCAVIAALPQSPPLAQVLQQSGPQPKEDDLARALMDRVAEPAKDDIDTFKKAGMQNVSPHRLTPGERKAVEAALAALPALNKRVLERHLHNLAFVDGIPGEGTGLTSPNKKTGLSDITLRASVIDESLTTFLTNKERRVYKRDGSEMTITVTGTGTNALTYVLLHESTHVLDVSCGVTNDPGSRFVQGIWAKYLTMAPSLAAITPTTYFRGADHLPIAKASSVYDSLAETPFVSLYATASRQEDLAELVAWHEIYTQDSGDLTIELRDAQGKTVKQWHPLTFPKVRARFTDVDQLLSSQPHCASQS
jgi:hypothetical protein